jgi:hypothetical protein
MRIGVRRVLFELLMLLVGVKPGVDTYRALFHDQEDGALLTPQQELMFSKCIEMFCESIFSAVFQLMAILDEDEQNPTALVSVVVSILTISLNATTITYDMDVKESNRRMSPFYGMFRNGTKNRFMEFASMWFFNMFSVASQVLSCAILANRGYLVWKVLLEMAVYLAYKTLRGDLLLWIPVYGALGVAISILHRVVVKFIADFT